MNIKLLTFLILITAYSCGQKNQSNSVFDELNGANIQPVTNLELVNNNDDLSFLKVIVQNSQIGTFLCPTILRNISIFTPKKRILLKIYLRLTVSEYTGQLLAFEEY